jgi:hypothetical protein
MLSLRVPQHAMSLNRDTTSMPRVGWGELPAPWIIFLTLLLAILSSKLLVKVGIEPGACIC